MTTTDKTISTHGTCIAASRIYVSPHPKMLSVIRLNIDPRISNYETKTLSNTTIPEFHKQGFVLHLSKQIFLLTLQTLWSALTMYVLKEIQKVNPISYSSQHSKA